jgi:cell division protein FtsI (penicillin-binding protein 3)
MLERVVTDGTAQNLQNASFSIAGKTGTAQISQGKDGYKRNKTNYQASFVGYFPADKPLYSCIVVVNAPSRNVYYGNLVAGPIFEEIANKVYSTSLNAQEKLVASRGSDSRPHIPIAKNGKYDDLKVVYEQLGIPYISPENSEWVAISTGKDTANVTPRKFIQKLVPNVVGMAAEDAIYLLENSGIKVEIEGRGVVKQQSILPGQNIPSGGAKIRLRLA